MVPVYIEDIRILILSYTVKSYRTLKVYTLSIILKGTSGRSRKRWRRVVNDDQAQKSILGYWLKVFFVDIYRHNGAIVIDPILKVKPPDK